MNKFTTGMLIGSTFGMAAYMMMEGKDKRKFKRNRKKWMNKASRIVDGIVDSI